MEKYLDKPNVKTIINIIKRNIEVPTDYAEKENIRQWLGDTKDNKKFANYPDMFMAIVSENMFMFINENKLKKYLLKKKGKDKCKRFEE